MFKNKFLKYLIYVVILLLILAIVGKRTGIFGGNIVWEVAVDTAKHQTITELITANGKIQPEVEVKISSDVSGEIVELHVKEGDEVEKGQLLLRIRPDIYVSNFERMEAALNASRSNLANAIARKRQVEAQFIQTEQNYKRNKSLYDQKTISQSEYDNALAAYSVGKAEVEAAIQNVGAAEFNVKSGEASLKEALENLSKTSIYAPVKATVSRLNVELGERVVGTIQMTGTELLRLANLNNMEVRVDVSENDILRVSHGDTSIIEIDAYPNRIFKGIVTHVANSATSASGLGGSISTDQVANFEVRIKILSESFQDLIPQNVQVFYPFRPGMSATVDIQTKTVFNALAVPIQSVTVRQDTTNQISSRTEQRNEYVFVYNGEIVNMKKVETGIQDENFIQIIKGINPNDIVISSPYTAISRHLKDGDKVKVVDRKSLFENK